MAEITRLAPSATKPVVRVHLDGSFWATLPVGLVADEHLRVGENLTDARRSSLEDRAQTEQAFAYAVRSLDFRMASRAKMGERLTRKGYAPSVITQTLERCDALGILNDDALARGRARRLMEEGQAPYSARQRLRKQGFAPEVVEGALDEAYATFDAEAVARRLLESRPSTRKTRQRAYAFLARRGFGPDVISRVTAELAPAATKAAAAARGALDVAALEKQVRRRYPTAGSDAGAGRRAYAYCVRHGATSAEAQQLLQRLRDS